MPTMNLAECLFDRPADSGEWYYDCADEIAEFIGKEAVVQGTEIFANIDQLSSIYSEQQICLGLQCLIDQTYTDLCFSFVDASIAEDIRLMAISNMFYVFDRVFSKNCLNIFPERKFASRLSYQYTCYMWWHIFPRHGVPQDRDLASLDTAILSCMEKVLSLDALGCKESALHGLGHWHSGCSAQVDLVIDRCFPKIPHSLQTYAQSARRGDVQ